MFTSRRVVTPYLGKTELVTERAKKMSAIMEAHGANTRVAQVYAGEHELGRLFESRTTILLD